VTVTGEYVRTWAEIVACFKIKSRNSPGETEEDYGGHRKDNQ
jgi:hypothetical protein